jgi:hypothetical protein
MRLNRLLRRNDELRNCAMAETKHLATCHIPHNEITVAEQNSLAVRDCADTDVPLNSNKLLLLSIGFRQMARASFMLSKGAWHAKIRF